MMKSIVKDVLWRRDVEDIGKHADERLGFIEQRLLDEGNLPRAGKVSSVRGKFDVAVAETIRSHKEGGACEPMGGPLAEKLTELAAKEGLAIKAEPDPHSGIRLICEGDLRVLAKEVPAVKSGEPPYYLLSITDYPVAASNCIEILRKEGRIEDLILAMKENKDTAIRGLIAKALNEEFNKPAMGEESSEPVLDKEAIAKGLQEMHPTAEKAGILATIEYVEKMMAKGKGPAFFEKMVAEAEKGGNKDTIRGAVLAKLCFERMKEALKEKPEAKEESRGVKSAFARDKKEEKKGGAEAVAEYECPTCGSAVNAGDERCGTCGENFDIEEYECPTCHSTILEDDNKCPSCGEVFEEQDPNSIREAATHVGAYIDEYGAEEARSSEVFKDFVSDRIHEGINRKAIELLLVMNEIDLKVAEVSRDITRISASTRNVNGTKLLLELFDTVTAEKAAEKKAAKAGAGEKKAAGSGSAFRHAIGGKEDEGEHA